MVAAVPLPLTSGAYSAQNIIANYQRCVNLYPESNPQETHAPVPVTHLLAPGLRTLLSFAEGVQVRGVYEATDGSGYAVCGTGLYYLPPPVDGVWNATLLGQIAPGTTQVKFADNGIDVLVADGTSNGYVIDMTTKVMSGITAAGNSGTNGFAYYGANYLDFTDTFIFGNRPGTDQWWATASNSLAMDPLSIAAKSGLTDQLQGVVALQRYVMLIGTLATEWWYNAGGTNFPYAIMTGPYLEHGARAQYSIRKAQEAVMFLSQSKDGKGIFLRVEDYRGSKKSTFALEDEWVKYPTIDDAIAFSFQLSGHTFVGLRFPTADKTWVYDMATDQWHERTTLDSQGLPHQWRVNCSTALYGTVIGGDYANGKLYEITQSAQTDDGVPIQRIRGFPHIMQNLARIRHNFVTLDLDVGNPVDSQLPQVALSFDDGLGTPGGVPWDTEDGLRLLGDPDAALQASLRNPRIYLRYSKDRGHSWSSLLACALAPTGDYTRIIQWRRLSMARDMIMEFSWIAPQITALNQAYIGPLPSMN